MSDPLSGSDLDELLGRWVAEGWIEAGQAARIRAGEAARAQAAAPGGMAVPAPAESPRRAPLVVEALGYLGGVIAIVAGVVAVDQLWPGIPTGAELAFAAAGTVVRAADVVALQRALAAAGLASTVSQDGSLRTEAEAALVGRAAYDGGVVLTELRNADSGGLEEMFLELTADTQRERTAA